MVTLVVGVLFAIGIIAIVAVILLAASEQRAQNQTAQKQTTISGFRAATAAPHEPQRSAVPTAVQGPNSSLSSPGVPKEQQRSVAPTAGSSSSLTSPGISKVPSPSDVTEKMRPLTTAHLSSPGNDEEQSTAGPTDQLHALLRELQALHQQSSEIERRLALLSEIAIRQERIQSGHVDMNEESPPVPDSNR